MKKVLCGLLTLATISIILKITINRRTKRGLFVSNNGTQINADINAAYQIIKKVHPNIQYTTIQIDTRGSFFNTFKKQHINKGKVKDLQTGSKTLNKKTKFYLHEGKITQVKLFKLKHKKFRPNYERTFTLFLKEVQTTNKVA